MRGLTSTAAGILLLGVTLWLFSRGGTNATVLVCGVAALILLYRGYQGLTITQAAGDAMMPMELISNPRGAMLDFAAQQVENLINDARGKPEDSPADERPFDADAIIARYMEQRAGEPPAIPNSASAARGFGRKGL